MGHLWSAYRLSDVLRTRLWGGIPLGSSGLSWLGLGTPGFYASCCLCVVPGKPPASVSPCCRRGRESWVTGSRVL